MRKGPHPFPPVGFQGLEFVQQLPAAAWGETLRRISPSGLRELPPAAAPPAFPRQSRVTSVKGLWPRAAGLRLAGVPDPLLQNPVRKLQPPPLPQQTPNHFARHTWKVTSVRCPQLPTDDSRTLPQSFHCPGSDGGCYVCVSPKECGCPESWTLPRISASLSCSPLTPSKVRSKGDHSNQEQSLSSHRHLGSNPGFPMTRLCHIQTSRLFSLSISFFN